MAVHGSSHHITMSPWAVGLATFAGMLMVLGGIFEALQGLAAVVNQSFFVVGHNYIYKFNVTTWGWIHLTLGVLVALAGIFVFSGQAWARGVGIFLALLSAIANFFYIPYYPVWSILIIALDVGIMWALASYNPAEV